MRPLVIIFCFLVPTSRSCRGSNWYPDSPYNNYQYNETYFSPGNTWGGWTPPAGNEDWLMWVEMWGQGRTTDQPSSEELASERGPSWPQHWTGYGHSLGGVPPPPWAYFPDSYDRPQYCYYLPQFGDCFYNMTRWGYNPATALCQTFFYSGCGGNENNFMHQEECITACIDVVDSGCKNPKEAEFDGMVHFEFP